MEAEKLQWVPDSLYNTSVAAIVATQNTYNRYRRELKTLPEDVQFDIYQGVSCRRRHYMLMKLLLASTVRRRDHDYIRKDKFIIKPENAVCKQCILYQLKSRSNTDVVFSLAFAYMYGPC